MAVFKNKRQRRKLVAEINVVPYIDVMLVLLIVFMVATPLLMQGVEVELPQANSLPVDNNNEEPVIVSIKADRTLYVNLGGDDEQVKPLAQIQSMVTKILKQNPEAPILVWGDKQVPYGEVVALMSALQIAGASSVGLVTEPARPANSRSTN